MSSRGAFMITPYPSPGSTKSEFALGEQIEWTPQQAIDDDHIEAHDGDAEHDAMHVAGIGLLGNISAEPLGFEVRIAPGRHLGNDAGVPRAAGRGNRAGHVIR